MLEGIAVDDDIGFQPQRMMQQHFAARHRAGNLLLFDQANQAKNQLGGDDGGGFDLNAGDLLKAGGSVVGHNFALALQFLTGVQLSAGALDVYKRQPT